MKITLKSNLNLKVTDLETQSATLAALLDEISNNSGLMPIYPDCEVLVNGQSYQILPAGLDTKLKDGDEVRIIMFMLGGG